MIASNIAGTAVLAGIAVDPTVLAGPLGGVVAAAFGAGAIAGYGFCVRTILRMANNRQVEQTAEIAALREEIKDNREEAQRELRDERAACKIEIEALRRRQLDLEDMLLGRRPLGQFTPLAVPVSDPIRDAQLLEEADRQFEATQIRKRRVRKEEK